MKSTSSFSPSSGGVVDQDVEGADLFGHRSVRSIDAVDVRDVHLDRECAVLLLFTETMARAFERRSVPPSQDHKEVLREELASCLQSEAAIRAGDKCDAFVVVATLAF